MLSFLKENINNHDSVSNSLKLIENIIFKMFSITNCSL